MVPQERRAEDGSPSSLQPTGSCLKRSGPGCCGSCQLLSFSFHQVSGGAASLLGAPALQSSDVREVFFLFFCFLGGGFSAG